MNIHDNVDAFFASIEVTPDTTVKIARIRDAVKTAILIIHRETEDSAEREMAINRLKEGYMWAARAVSMPRQGGLFDG